MQDNLQMTECWKQLAKCIKLFKNQQNKQFMQEKIRVYIKHIHLSSKKMKFLIGNLAK
jgi:Mg2+ and Co2+ transporter CorA